MTPEDELDGHTIEELSDYLDHGRSPRNRSIEASPGCQNALQAMERLRDLAEQLAEADTEAEKERADDRWLQRLLAGIVVEARPGRRIPLEEATPISDLGITEGAVRSLIRDAETDAPGIVVGRTRLHGDLGTATAEVSVNVDVGIVYGHNIETATERLRTAIADRLAAHTSLQIRVIDITVRDLHEPDEVDGTPEELG